MKNNANLAQARIDRAIKEEGDYYATHPSMVERFISRVSDKYELGKILQMQLFRLLMHRTDLLYTCSGEDRHKVKSQCLLIQSILYLQHLIQVRSQHTEAFLAVNISAKLMNF